MDDLISRQAAVDALARMMPRSYTPDGSHPADEEIFRAQEVFADCIEALEILPSAQPEPQWIPFKTRPLTEEEQDEHPEWDCILDCKLPDDGQVILVSINLRGHERVQYDEFYTDDGSYLDSGYAIGAEATAWMPMPEPYKEEIGEIHNRN